MQPNSSEPTTDGDLSGQDQWAERDRERQRELAEQVAASREAAREMTAQQAVQQFAVAGGLLGVGVLLWAVNAL